MACNWQYDNPPSNKRVWWVVITITVIGKILILVGIIGGYADHDCFHKFRDCRDTSTNEECTNYYDELCSIKTWTGLIIAGAVVWVFGACFTSYFCCCSQPAKQEPQSIALQAIPYPQGGPGGYPPQQAVVGVPMAGGAAYAQHPYAYPPPGAYGGPPPGHWPQGAPPPPYPGAPPPMQQPFHQPELTTATVLTQGLPNSSAPETSAGTAQWKGV